MSASKGDGEVASSMEYFCPVARGISYVPAGGSLGPLGMKQRSGGSGAKYVNTVRPILKMGLSVPTERRKPNWFCGEHQIPAIITRGFCYRSFFFRRPRRLGRAFHCRIANQAFPRPTAGCGHANCGSSRTWSRQLTRTSSSLRTSTRRHVQPDILFLMGRLSGVLQMRRHFQFKWHVISHMAANTWGKRLISAPLKSGLCTCQPGTSRWGNPISSIPVSVITAALAGEENTKRGLLYGLNPEYVQKKVTIRESFQREPDRWTKNVPKKKK